MELALSDHLLAFEHICDINDDDGRYAWLEDDDGHLCRVSYEAGDGDVVISFTPHAGTPRW